MFQISRDVSGQPHFFDERYRVILKHDLVLNIPVTGMMHA
jgi:hypothetical protein